MVEIRVHYPFQTAVVLEEELRSQLGLLDCRILAHSAVDNTGGRPRRSRSASVGAGRSLSATT